MTSPSASRVSSLLLLTFLLNFLRCTAFVADHPLSGGLNYQQAKELRAVCFAGGCNDASSLDEEIPILSSWPLQSKSRRECVHIMATTIVSPTVLLPGIVGASTSTTSSVSSTSVSTNEDKKIVSLDPELSAAAQRLFDLDSNRLLPGKEYAIDIQDSKKPSKNEDAAPGPLFRFVDATIFSRPTFSTFVALLNNYNANVCAAEDVSDEKRAEGYAFLRAAMATPVMQFCYQYCRSRNPESIPERQEDFIKLLYKIWFKLYRRCDREEDEKVRGSCGFEHVFVGEIKDGKVAGFHNWIQFYLQEQMGNVDYRGSVGAKPPNADTRVLTYQLRWNGFVKYVGTSFIGVSPEFELAFYTTMFLLGKQDNIIVLNTGAERVKLDVKCYKIAKGKVGACFVEAVSG